MIPDSLDDNFSYFMEKYSYYNDMCDKIMNMKPGEQNSVLSLIYDIINTHNIDIQPIYQLISIACEIKIIYIREYWELFEQFLQHFEMKPVTDLLSPLIRLLYHVKYKKPRYLGNIPDYLQKYKQKSIEDILNIFESDPIMKCIIHDDIKSLKDIIDSYFESFDFEMQLFERSLIENCCYCGSVDCFRFLRSNNVKISQDCLKFSINGRNKSIIDECLQVCTVDTSVMKECVKIHDLQMLITFYQNYTMAIPYHVIQDYLNLPVLFYQATDPDPETFLSVINESIVFGIPSLVSELFEINGWVFKFDHHYEDYAAKYNLVEVLKVLIDICKKNSIHFSYKDQLKPATLHNCVEAATILIENRADVNEGAPLIVAAHYDNIEVARILIKAGADIQCVNQHKTSPIHAAAIYDSIEVLNLLIENGANIEIKDRHGRTPLMNAVFSNSILVAKRLIECGAEIETYDFSNFNALLWAIVNNYPEMTRILLKAGANIEAQFLNKETPLIMACMGPRTDIAKILVEFGANIEAKDGKDCTPLIHAAVNNNEKLTEFLIENGANINERESGGRTPLMCAAVYNGVNAVKKLIELGADLNVKDNDGKSALDLAIMYNSTQVIALLQTEDPNTTQSNDGDNENPNQSNE